MAKDPKRPRKGEKYVKLAVQVDLLERAAGEPPVGTEVYAFGNGGRLIARSPLGKDGKAVLPIPLPGEAKPVHVLAGPALEDETPKMSDLLRRGSEKVKVRIHPEVLNPSATVTVIPAKWSCWFLSLCFVPGTLTKRTELDGIPPDR